MDLSGLTSVQAGALLGGRPVVVVPLGSTEQHGELAPLSCDTAVAHAICREAARAAGVCCTPPLPFGFSECHTGFPGTVSLSANTLSLAVEDIVRSFVIHGARVIVFLSGHGGNRRPVESALERLRPGHPGVRLEYMGYWNLPGAQELELKLFDGHSGFHATAAEVSIYMHLFPEFTPAAGAVRQYPPSPSGPMTAEEWKAAYPDGPAGVDARQASPAKGAELFAFLCRSLADVLSRMEGCSNV